MVGPVLAGSKMAGLLPVVVFVYYRPPDIVPQLPDDFPELIDFGDGPVRFCLREILGILSRLRGLLNRRSCRPRYFRGGD